MSDDLIRHLHLSQVIESYQSQPILPSNILYMRMTTSADITDHLPHLCPTTCATISACVCSSLQALILLDIFCHTCMCMGQITCIYMQMLEEGIYHHLLWLFTLFLNTGYSSKSKARCFGKDAKALPVSATQCWVTGMVPIF